MSSPKLVLGEGVALPQIPAIGRRDVVEVVEQPLLVRPHGGVDVGLGEPHLATAFDVARVGGAEDLREHLRVRPGDVPAGDRPDVRVVEVGDERREPVLRRGDGVLGEEDQDAPAGPGREQIARVAVVELDPVDTLALEADGEVRGACAESSHVPSLEFESIAIISQAKGVTCPASASRTRSRNSMPWYVGMRTETRGASVMGCAMEAGASSFGGGTRGWTRPSRRAADQAPSTATAAGVLPEGLGEAEQRRARRLARRPHGARRDAGLAGARRPSP